jgi:hypothetical protein
MNAIITMLHQHSHVVTEEAVKTHVLKTDVARRTSQLRLIVGAKCEGRVTASNDAFPNVRKRDRRTVERTAELDGNHMPLLLLRSHTRWLGCRVIAAAWRLGRSR